MEIFGVYLVNQSSGATIPLSPERDNIIGRGIPSPQGEFGKVLLPHPSISKIHAVISLSPNKNKWILYDKSRHGIYVNGNKVEKKVELSHGDKIQLGPFTLMFYEKFKADDETSEEPLPQIEESSSLNYISIFILLFILCIDVFLFFFYYKILIFFSFSLLIFSLLLLVIKPFFKDGIKISYITLILLLILSLLGNFLWILKVLKII